MIIVSNQFNIELINDNSSILLILSVIIIINEVIKGIINNVDNIF